MRYHKMQPTTRDRPNYRRVGIRLDVETWEEIRKLAEHDNICLSDKVRELIEWGLEEERWSGKSGSTP